METTMQNEEIEIDLWELISVLISKIWLIILSGVILALAVLIGTKLFITPQYESVTQIYVLSKQNNDVLTSSDLQASALLTQDYQKIIQSRTVAESVVAKLDLEIAPEELIKKISVSVEDSSRVVSITVTDSDPYRACEMANCVRDMAAEHIINVMDYEAVNVVDEASIPKEPSSPHVMKNGFLGGILGCFLAVVLIIILHLTNDTIKTSEDVERYLGISTLGIIPVNGTDGKQPKAKKARRSRKKP